MSPIFGILLSFFLFFFQYSLSSAAVVAPVTTPQHEKVNESNSKLQEWGIFLLDQLEYDIIQRIISIKDEEFNYLVLILNRLDNPNLRRLSMSIFKWLFSGKVLEINSPDPTNKLKEIRRILKLEKDLRVVSIYGGREPILKSPRKGLMNVGNACYFSSTLQIFRHAPGYFLDDLLTPSENLNCTFTENKSFLCAIRNFLLPQDSDEIKITEKVFDTTTRTFTEKNLKLLKGSKGLDLRDNGGTKLEGILKDICAPFFNQGELESLKNWGYNSVKDDEAYKGDDDVEYLRRQMIETIKKDMRIRTDCSTIELIMLKYIRMFLAGQLAGLIGAQDDASILPLRLFDAISQRNNESLRNKTWKRFHIGYNSTYEHEIDGHNCVQNNPGEIERYESLKIDIDKNIQAGINRALEPTILEKRCYHDHGDLTEQNFKFKMSIKVVNAPKLLAVLITRAKFDVESGLPYKDLSLIEISDRIAIPAERMKDGKDVRYRLYAIIDYKLKDESPKGAEGSKSQPGKEKEKEKEKTTGKTEKEKEKEEKKQIDEGHYIARIRLGDGKWWTFDDSKEPVQEDLPEKSDKMYILYYIRIEE